jgi:8-oxo-dGTP pyrophosphatase MutT (NUDIX family)
MKFEIEWKGNFYDCEWFDDIDFEKINEEVRSVRGFIFNNKGNLCLVKFPDKKNWDVPGGHPESYDKSYEDTLIREVNEEADLDLKNIKRLGYLRAVPRGDFDNVNYSLHYVAEIEKIKEQTIDPAEGVVPIRKFIDPKKFIDYTKWADTGNFEIKKAIKLLNLN